MKVKCNLCGLKGFYDINSISEFHAQRFKLISIYKYKGFANPKNSKFICRSCIKSIIDSLAREQSQINDLYKPEIKDKLHTR